MPSINLQRQSGFSLIESLVSLLILALGVLGMLGIQLKSLSDNQNATQRTLAIRLANDLFERTKANPGGISGIAKYSLNSSWASVSTPPVACNTTACSADQQAAFDLWQWQYRVKNTLPGGNATAFVSPSDPEQLGVMVAWRLRQTDAASTTTANSERASWLNVDVPGGPSCPADSICAVAYGKP